MFRKFKVKVSKKPTDAMKFGVLDANTNKTKNVFLTKSFHFSFNATLHVGDEHTPTQTHTHTNTHTHKHTHKHTHTQTHKHTHQ